MTLLNVVEDTTTDIRLQEPGDHELLSHYITKAASEKAILDGIPATALCGKKWLPTRDPQKFPVCPECQDAYDKLEKDD